MLRRWLSAPSIDLHTIVLRQTAMRSLFMLPELCDEISNSLKGTKTNVESLLNRTCLKIQTWLDSGNLDLDDGSVLTKPLHTKYCYKKDSSSIIADDDDNFVSEREDMLKVIVSDLTRLIDASCTLSGSCYRVSMQLYT